MTPHPGACKHSLLIDERPDVHFVVQFGTWNISSLSGKGREVYGEFKKRMIDVCCLRKVRQGRRNAKMLGMKRRRHKLWWSGKGDGVDGVGVMMEMCEKVVEVIRVNDRVMTRVAVF